MVISIKKIYKVNFEKGYYLFKLEQLLEDKKISKNKIMNETNTDFKVLKRLWSGDLVRIDITVLAKICDYLNCEIDDIFEYVSQKNNTK